METMKKQTSQDKYDRIPHCFKVEAGWEIFYTHLSFDQQKLVDFLCEAPDEVEELRSVIKEGFEATLKELDKLQKGTQ